MKLQDLQKLKIPDKPGVYFFQKDQNVLYVGKAASLKDRVRSYFSSDLLSVRGPLINDMVFKANKIKWRSTDSVLEALILEANLIKKHQPKYNTKEKSDKSFNFVVLTRENPPRILITRGKKLSPFTQSNVFGPYPNSKQLREALRLIRRIFPFLDDKSPGNLKFYKQVALIPDVNSSQGLRKYKQDLKHLKLFFQGKKKQILKSLEREMKKLVKAQEFEKAGELKRQLFSLKHINDIALIQSQNFRPSVLRLEAYDVAHLGGRDMVGVMTVVSDGEAVKSEYKKFSARGGSAFGGKTVLGNSKANDTGALVEILKRRLAHPGWVYPSLVVVDGGVAQLNAAQGVLRKFNLDIPVVAVVKNERHKPIGLKGEMKFIDKHKKEILLANSEAHRFAINYHKKLRSKNFLR